MAFCKSERIHKVVANDGDTVTLEHTGRTTFGPEDGQTAEEFLAMWPVGGSWNTGGPEVGDSINTVISNDGQTCVIEHSGRSTTTAHVKDGGKWKVGEVFGISYDRESGRETVINPLCGRVQ
jgi:hypothetical protein